MKKRIVNSILILIIAVTLLTLTGCGNKSEENNNQTQTNEITDTTNNIMQSTTQAEVEKQVINEFSNISSFQNGIALLTNNNITYVINENFEVINVFKQNISIGNIKDGYIQLEDETNTETTNIIDVATGEIAFSYNISEYKDVELISNGCLIIKTQTDTYNSSKIEEGIYSLKEKKYILEPDEKYVENLDDANDGMVSIEGSSIYPTDYFNTKTKKIVTYEDKVYRNFTDGYSVIAYTDNNSDINYLKVFDENGKFKLIKRPEGKGIYTSPINNGLYISDSVLYNLEEGTAKDLSSEFHSISNQVQFTEDGYALIIFRNQSNVPYYTVIDKTGKKLFEPVKIDTSKGDTRELESRNLEDGYIIAKDNGKEIVLDMNNNIVLTAEEGEIFEEITNGVVIICNSTNGLKYYYKNMEGNKVDVTVSTDSGITIPNNSTQTNETNKESLR